MPRNPYLCLANLAFLGAACVLSLGGIVWLNALGREPHPALVSVCSAALGSLSSFLVSVPRGSHGSDRPPAEGGEGSAVRRRKRINGNGETDGSAAA